MDEKFENLLLLFSFLWINKGDVGNIQYDAEFNLTMVYLVLGHSIDSLK